MVVTDMQMPEMDGVSLLRKMRLEYPLIPAIMVTAYGNEDLASEALGVGASNFISKDHAAILLPEMVQRMKLFSAANAETLDLKGALTRNRFEFILDCSLDRITPLVCLQLRLLAAMNVLHTGDRLRIAEALDYLLFHCIVHGNLERPTSADPLSRESAERFVIEQRSQWGDPSSAEPTVSLSLSVTDREARYVVSRDGNGPSITHAPLPGTPQSFADERGRAMLLLTSVMNEVFVDPSNGDVTLVKYID